MTSRERMIAAVNRKTPDKVPVTLAYGHIDNLCAARGKKGFVGKFRQDQATIGFKGGAVDRAAFAPYLPDLPQEAYVNEWGVASVRSSTGASSSHIAPLAGLHTVAELEKYPFPDMMRPECHAHLEAAVLEIQKRGVAAVGNISQTIFELSWAMRGMEQWMMDTFLNQEFLAALLDRITDIRIKMARRFVEAGVDILRVGDDVGTQKAMMMSPEMWREWLKPRLAAVIQSACEVKPDIPVKYHSDGFIEDIIPELCETGVTILNPVQPECMDPAKLKKMYGDRLAFWGTIGTQTTMPLGSPAEVRETVRERIRTVGKNGGLVLAPTHSINPDVPWENVVAFYEAAEEFGRY